MRNLISEACFVLFFYSFIIEPFFLKMRLNASGTSIDTDRAELGQTILVLVKIHFMDLYSCFDLLCNMHHGDAFSCLFPEHGSISFSQLLLLKGTFFIFYYAQ